MQTAEQENSPTNVLPLAHFACPILEFACFANGGCTGTRETILSCTRRIRALSVPGAIIGRIRAGNKGAEARRECSHGLERGCDLDRLSGEQRTPSLRTRCVSHQRQVNRLVGQRSLDGGTQRLRGKSVLLTSPSIRRCELGDTCQLERCKTIGRR